MNGSLAALWYIATRTVLRRILSIIRSPLQLLLLLAIPGGLIALQINQVSLPPQLHIKPTYVLIGMIIITSLSGMRGAFKCPVRLRPADVAWVLPVSNGSRLLVAYNILVYFSGVFGLFLVGVALQWFAAGELTVAPFALAGLAALFLTSVRVAAYSSYMLFCHAIPRLVIVIGWLVYGVILTTVAVYSELLAIVAVVIGLIGCVVTTIRLADRYQDAAAQQAWEFAAIQAAFHKGAWGSGSLSDMSSRKLQRNVRTFSYSKRAVGAAAFAWSALAQLRRTWRQITLTTFVLMCVSSAAAIFLTPPFSLAPLVMATMVALTYAHAGSLTKEFEHPWLQLAPGQPAKRLLAVQSIPFFVTALILNLVWVPWIILNGQINLLPSSVLIASGLAALITSATTASAAAKFSAPSQLAINILGVGGSIGLAYLLQGVMSSYVNAGFIFAGIICLEALGYFIVTLHIIKRPLSTLKK